MAATERTEVRAVAKYVRTAPRKAQLVADQIRGRSVPEARTILAFMTRDAARDVEKVLRSAVANAEANHSLDGDELVVATAEIGAGPTLKRWRARARGRVGRIRKRTCHISITLALPDGGVIAEPTPAPAERPRRAPRRTQETPAATEETPETMEETPAAAEPAEAPAAEAAPAETEVPEPAPPADVEEAPEEKKPRGTTRSRKADESTEDAEPKPRRTRRKRETEPSGESEPSEDKPAPPRRKKTESEEN
jgi:large subunit ribosomal protein L22